MVMELEINKIAVYDDEAGSAPVTLVRYHVDPSSISRRTELCLMCPE